MCDGTGRAPENSCCTPWGGSHRGKDRRCARGPNLKLSKKITSIAASPVDLLFHDDIDFFCKLATLRSLLMVERVGQGGLVEASFSKLWTHKQIFSETKKTGLDSTGLGFAGMEFPHGSSLPGWELQSCRSCKLDWELHLRNMRQTYSRYRQAVTSLSSVETVHSELL